MRVVTASHNSAIADWKISPAVLLAIITSLVNVFLSMLLSFGSAVHWWRSASRGTTLKRLHLIWERGMSFSLLSALVSSSETRKIALAALFVALAKISSGPLLQDAVVTSATDNYQSTSMNARLIDRIPDGSLGVRTGDSALLGATVSTRSMGADVYRAWASREAIFNTNAYVNTTEWLRSCPDDSTDTCGGFACPVKSTCSGNVNATGISVTCTNRTQPVNLRDPINVGKRAFSIHFEMDNSTAQPVLNMFVDYVAQIDSSCIATYVSEKCSIQTATVNYPIMLNRSILNFDLQNIQHLEQFDSPGDSFFASPGTPAGPLTSMFAILGEYYETESRFDAPNSVTRSNSISLQY